MPNIIELQGITKSFGSYVALDGINLDVADGEILTLLGPSGCGKTTLMRIVAGFERPSRGEVVLSGRSITATPPEKRPVNMVFQRYALFPHLDVFDNIAFGLRLKDYPEAEIKDSVTDMLKLVQLGDFGSRWIHELSGGQAQRVALARALVNRPAVLLLDEPLAALDLKIRHHMLGELKRIHTETKTTFIYVTHDQDEAMILSDRIVLMNRGTIEQIGTPEEMYAAPKTLFCARFFGDTNIFDGKVAATEGGATTVDIGCGIAAAAMNGVAPGAPVSLSIRPEAITLSKVDGGTMPGNVNSLRGTLENVVFIGSRVVYEVRGAGDRAIKCQETRPVSGVRIQPGAEVQLDWSEDAVVLLTH